MLCGIIHSSKICTGRTASSCSRMRSFAEAVENNNIKNNESGNDTELQSAIGSANSAIHEAETTVISHQSLIRDITLKVTHLEKAMESDDIPQILAAARDLKQNLDFSGYSSRNEHTLPTELTVRLLQRFGGKPSFWIGRNLRALLMNMLKTKVDSLQVSDRSANLTLAKTIVASIVLSLLYYLQLKHWTYIRSRCKMQSCFILIIICGGLWQKMWNFEP